MQRRIGSMVRAHSKNDIKTINELGKLLHDNYEFNLDIYSRCLVIEKNDEIVGFIVYSIIYNRAEIIDIVIDKSKRNNGLGKELLQAAIFDCKKSNCVNITLEVNESNSIAINFYKTNGFKIVAIRKKYYGNLDGYLMKMEVK